MSAIINRQLDLPLKITTPLGPDALLIVGFSGHEGVSQLFRFQLDLLAENRKKVPFDKLLGKPVTICLSLGGDKSRQFCGIVSRFSEGGRDKFHTTYRAEVVPALWLLTRRAQSRIFQHESVPHILKKVLHGLDVTYKLQGTYHPRNYCVQYRESDFAFASRLMEEEGIFYFFEHADGKHKMVVADTPAGHLDMPGQNSFVYDDMEGGNRPDFRVTAWEKVQEIRPGKVTFWDHSFELPGSTLEAQRLPVDQVAVGEVHHAVKLGVAEPLEIYEYPGSYAHHQDGIDRGGGERRDDLRKIFDENRRAVEVRMQQETVAGLQIKGAGNCRQFVSGHKFALTRHHHGNGEYVLTGVDHVATLGGDYRSGDGICLNYENLFTCIPAALPFRPAQATPRPRVDGAQTAVVVGPRGEEIFTDKYGRVKVQFPWDRHGKYDADSSCWVRVATPWAGKGWGGVHVPRIGQEVVVDFLEGDPDRPLIVGSVFNADQMPPFTLPGARQVSGFKTNSYPTTGGSNEITIDDTKGKEKMTIHAQFDQSTTVDHDQSTTVHNNRTTTVDVNSTETVKGKKTTTVNGTVLETYNDTLSTIVKSGVLLTSTGAHIHVIAATEILLHTGASTLHMKSDGTIELIGVKINVSAKATADVDAPKIGIHGGEKVLMGVGGQTVLCDPGQVAVSGAEVNSTAEGTHNIKGALVKIN
jgi:type VI secretion system secreted protein VgrG